ncbi:hypothetical protein TNCV_4569351 [Trichonephila clavipes]|nr:hypothetical protein TNCV_4569351 [Trichonephila clavipes]
MTLYRSPLTVTLWPSSFLKKYGPMFPPAHKAHQTDCHGWLGCSQSGRPIFDDFFQHLWPYIGNNTANVVFQMVKRLWLIRIDQ